MSFDKIGRAIAIDELRSVVERATAPARVFSDLIDDAAASCGSSAGVGYGPLEPELRTGIGADAGPRTPEQAAPA